MRLTEFLILAKKGLPNIDKIAEGWINDAKLENNELKEEELVEILQRRKICNECPFNSINAVNSIEYFEAFNENYKTSRNDLHCSLCGCPVSKKTASLSSSCAIAEEDIFKKLNVPIKWVEKG